MKNYVVSVSAVIFTVLFVTLPVVWSDSGFRREGWTGEGSRSGRYTAVSDPLYAEECGSCHMAYPPRLLPAASWEKMMAGLDDHFGDNAELDPDTRESISAFLRENSNVRATGRRGRVREESIGGDPAPLRISETPRFIREHDDIPARMVTDNPDVMSFGNCKACHQRAEQGSFSEHDIRIPGFSRRDR